MLLGFLLAAGTVTEPASIGLFRSACMDGRATLKKDAVRIVTLADMPSDARAALAQSQVEVGEVKLSPGVPTARQVSNPIYRIAGEAETYLVLPLSSPEAKNFGALCAVVVNGDVAENAAKLFPDPSKVGSMFTVSEPGGARADIPYKSEAVDGKMMVVAQRKGWTLISVAPDERPARLRHP